MSEPSLTQINQEFAQQRQSRLDSALTQALSSKLPPSPKGPGTVSASSSANGAASRGGRLTPASPASASQTAAPATSPSAGSASSTATEDSSAALPTDTGSADPGLVALGLEGVPADAGAPADGEAQDGAAEAAQPAVDLGAVGEAAKKKDLRAVEKLLGLDEGVLGATNGEYAALRRRQKEVEEAHEKNNSILIQKFGPTSDLLTHASQGDLIAYGRTIEQTTGVPIQVFIEHWVKNIHKLTPQQLHQSRQLVAAAQQPQVTQTPPDKALPAPAAAEAATAKANTYLTTEAKDHPAFKLRGGLDEVRAAWLASYDKASRSFKLSPQKAADKVVADRRAAHEQEQWVLSGKTPPPKQRTRTINRTGASETNVRDTAPKSRAQLIEEGADNMRRQKQADAARVIRK